MSQVNPFESPAAEVDELPADAILVGQMARGGGEVSHWLVVRWRVQSADLQTLAILWFVQAPFFLFFTPALVLVMRWFWGRWFREAHRLSAELGMPAGAHDALVSPWEWALPPWCWFRPFAAVRQLLEPDDRFVYSQWRLASITARIGWWGAVWGLIETLRPRGLFETYAAATAVLWLLVLCLVAGGAGGVALALLCRRILRRQREKLVEVLGAEALLAGTSPSKSRASRAGRQRLMMKA